MTALLSRTLLILLLGLSSCTFRYGPERIQDRGRYLTLQPGVSTPQDVRQRFGQPSDVVRTEAGTIWDYVYATAPMHAATGMPSIDLLAGGKTIDLIRADFEFDPHDRFVQVETSRNSRYQHMWVRRAEDSQVTAEAEQHVRAEMARCGLSFDEEAWKTAREALKLWAAPRGARRGAPFLGFTYAPDTLEIVHVPPGSSAALAGIQVGDRLIAIEGLTLRRAGDETRFLQTRQPGERVLVTVQRGTLQITTQVVLQQRGE